MTGEPGQTERFDVVGVTDTSIVTGCTLPSGSSTLICPGGFSQVSDRAAKVNFAPVSGPDVLERLSTIPIETWSYKQGDTSARHIGPMAQDFYEAFGLGEDDMHITTVDIEGVALAAIQGLYQLLQEKDAQIVALEDRLSALEEASVVN
ncbi:MAG: tail fiber domain-containing protein [Chloroflexi bacterium]|nr:tail fiber domain-containing protein [Chloroflexota bacterium]